MVPSSSDMLLFLHVLTFHQYTKQQTRTNQYPFTTLITTKNRVQLGRGKRGKPVYYSRNETYAMDWSLDDIDLNDVLVSVGTFGGPLGRYYLVCCVVIV